MKFKREEILAQLRSNIDAGKPIIGAGAGTVSPRSAKQPVALT